MGEEIVTNITITPCDVIKEGWLVKQSRCLKQWRKRWVILTPKYLGTFEKRTLDMVSTELLKLDECSNVKSADDTIARANSFRVDSPNCVFFFVSDSSTDPSRDKTEWINAICSQIFQARGNLNANEDAECQASKAKEDANKIFNPHKIELVDANLDEPIGTAGTDSKWKDAKKWDGPILHDVSTGEGKLHIYTGCAYMEGRRYWPGDGVVPKYPNGCQDRCFAAKVQNTGNTIALGLFDGSGGENAEKLATKASCLIREALVFHEEPLGNFEEWKHFLLDKFHSADGVILAQPAGLWEDTAGSTGVVSVIDPAHKKAIIAHVGDSRAFHFKRGHNTPEWQTKDHENTERSFGDQFRKLQCDGKKPVAVPDVHEIKDFAAGSAIVLVSDGVLNAFPTPDEGIMTIALKLDSMMAKLATQDTAAKDIAAAILKAAEDAAFAKEADKTRFHRDDMSVCLIVVEKKAT